VGTNNTRRLARVNYSYDDDRIRFLNLTESFFINVLRQGFRTQAPRVVSDTSATRVVGIAYCNDFIFVFYAQVAASE